MSENNFFEITSLQNEIVKDTAKLQQKKYRKDSGLMLLEGEKSVFEALNHSIELKYIISNDIKLLEHAQKNTKAKLYLANDKVMEKISSTKSPVNILSAVKEPNYKLEDILKKEKLLLLDNIKDAGNLGTIIRSACAFGVDGILLFGDCVDEFSSKVIRSSAGNIFKIPIVKLNSDMCLMQKIKKSHKIISTVAPYGKWGKSAKDCTNTTYEKPYVVMLGSEASGLCNELLSMADEHVTLMTNNNVESLNLAVFAGILLYIIKSKN